MMRGRFTLSVILSAAKDLTTMTTDVLVEMA